MLLRDGKTETQDPRCGLIFQPDLTAPHLLSMAPPDGGIDLSKRELISKYRVKKFGAPLLNQGQWSACGGFGFAAMLEHEPEIRTLGDNWALEFYFRTQDNDQWPGSERPGSDPVSYGTSIAAILQTAKQEGLITESCRAYTVEEVIRGIDYYGSAILGLEWTEGMMEPREVDGLITPGGAVVGGHCTAGTFVNLHQNIIGGPNSWEDWNPKRKGYWVMDLDDFAEVLRRGECAFARKVPGVHI